MDTMLHRQNKLIIKLREECKRQAVQIDKITKKYRSGQFYCSSAEGGIYALRKAHMRSILSLRSFPSVTFETVPVFV